MADRIKLLPDAVANQIAAGEVVNRPASVVKEMMENAVDAGARNVTVNFREGGRTLIQIVDDGCGMSPVDARLAFDKHATSKIREVEDIYHLATFGFRGEALASIASVAEVELRTRQEDEELGTKVEISGGKFVGQIPVSTAVGSQFIVRNLFYNVPARRRFLEKSASESRHIQTEYQRVALCHPEIAFSLYENDRLLSKLPASGLRQRVVGVIGKSIAKQLLEVGADTSIVRIEGFVGRPAAAKQNNTREQFLFVNGRYFKSSYFQKAIVAAYEKLIPANTQPAYFLYLTIDPERIDVNVHPQKTEVKFSDGLEIWQILNAAVRETLAKSGATPPMDFDMDTSIEIPVFRETTTYKVPEIKANPDFNPFERYDTLSEEGHNGMGRAAVPDRTPLGGGVGSDRSRVLNRRTGDIDAIAEDRFESEMPDFGNEDTFLPEGEDYESSVLEFISGEEASQGVFTFDGTTEFRDVLPWGNRYVVTVVEGALVVVDVRRASEAVLYEKYLLMLGNGNSVSQQLLFPETITLSIDDYTLLQEHLSEFASYGFDLILRDEHTVEVRGVPADCGTAPVESSIYELLDVLRDETGSTDELRRSRVAAVLARNGAFSGQRALSREEQVALLKELATCSNVSYTPSGLPIMTAFSEEEIKKRLK